MTQTARRHLFIKSASAFLVGEPEHKGDWTNVPITWKATFPEKLFPILSGRLELTPVEKKLTRLTLSGMYEPPLGRLGGLIDDAVMHSVAEATVREVAESIARQLGDPDLLARVLVDTAFAVVSLDGLDEQLARAEEAVRLADATGDPALRALARYHWSAVLLTTADVAGSRAVLSEGITIAAEASPSVQWMMETTGIRNLLLDGRMTEVLVRNDECMAMGQRLGEQDAASWWAALLTNVAWQRDDVGWMADQLKAFADHFSGTLVWRGCEAVVLSVAGRVDEALALLRDHGITPELLNEEKMPACGPMQLAFLSFNAQDRELAESVLRTLRPYRNCWAHFYLAAFAPISAALGLCEWVLGNLDAAVELYDEALARINEAGAVGLTPLFCAYDAQLLLERGDPGDAERARHLLDQALEGANLIGAPAIARKCEELAARLAQ